MLYGGDDEKRQAMLIASEEDLSAGIEALIAQVPIFAEALRLGGRPPLRRREGGLAGLVHIISGQQISAKAGRAIFARVEAAFPSFEADELAKASDDDFRACGLSSPKFRTVRACAEAVLDGRLEFSRLENASAEELHAILTSVKGIGPWSADIYALFCLGHPDAWPVGDLALQIAVQDLFGLAERPGPKAMEALSTEWRPWRSIAARLLWAYYGASGTRGDGVP